jgi:hypothetical protein
LVSYSQAGSQIKAHVKCKVGKVGQWFTMYFSMPMTG